MDIESIFSDSKWKILTELSHSPLSPTELANRTGTSISNISTQIRLLEALEFVHKEKVANIERGEPRKLYSLKKEFGYLVLGTKSVIGKKMFKLDEDSLFFFKVWMINDKNAPQALIKFYTEYEEQLRSVESIGYLGIRGDELEILIIHESPNDLAFFKEKSIKWSGKDYKLRIHVHKLYDVENGLNMRDEYFTSIIKKVFILTDNENKLSELKKR
jgi:hypothetical protein